jgi:glutamate 5-kinase
LPAGVTAARGTFLEGDTVDIVDARGGVLARGLAALDADVVRAVVGLRTGDLPAGVNHEAVHRDDLVVLPT